MSLWPVQWGPGTLTEEGGVFIKSRRDLVNVDPSLGACYLDWLMLGPHPPAELGTGVAALRCQVEGSQSWVALGVEYLDVKRLGHCQLLNVTALKGCPVPCFSTIWFWLEQTVNLLEL